MSYWDDCVNMNIATGGKVTEKDFPDDLFINHVTNTKLLQVSGKKTYLRYLDTFCTKIMPKKTIWYIINHPKEALAAILKYGENTKGRLGESLAPRTMVYYADVISSLIVHIQQIQENDPSILKQWRDIKRILREPVEAQIDTNQPNEQQREGIVPYNEFCRIRDNLPDGSQPKILFYLYSMIPVERSDYDQMQIRDEEPSNMNDGNWLILGKKNAFYFNDFKTAKVYGRIEIPLPKELVNQIHMSLEKEPRDYLFVNKKGEKYSTANAWNKWANRAIKLLTGNQQIQLRTLRHIYISHLLKNNDLTRGERKKIAEKMGHTVDTQDKYKWNIEDD